MSEQFKVGDVVQLRSGSVKMTVEKIDEDGAVICVWFEGTQPQRESFPAMTLQKADPPQATIKAI